MRLLVSVIVPTLDEEQALPGALDRIALLPGPVEIVVADGGSQDATVAAARSHPSGPRVVEADASRPSRAAQLNAAAGCARGDALVFLHADTRLPVTATATVGAALADPAVVGGNFQLRFDGPDRFSRALEQLYAALRRLGVYYGDSAIFVRAGVFESLGGFRPLAILEDYDFARRLERAGRTVCLPGPAVSSSRRWQTNGAARTLTTWVLIQSLYLLGTPASRLAGRYPGAR